MTVPDELVIRVAASMVLDQPRAVDAMKRLSRGASPDDEVYLIRAILEQASSCTGDSPGEDALDQALNLYHEVYHQEFPQGGDAGDHDNAHREAIYAVLALHGDGPQAPGEREASDNPEQVERAAEALARKFSFSPPTELHRDMARTALSAARVPQDGREKSTARCLDEVWAHLKDGQEGRG